MGRAIALTLVGAGASVALLARTAPEINALADAINTAGGHALSLPTDVGDAAQVAQMVATVQQAFGRVDILVNNAGLIHPFGKVWETEPAAWQRLLTVNVVGPYLCARAVLPLMLAQGSGRIIAISSGAAERNLAGASAYTTSKAALERFSGTLAAEVEGQGVVVTTLRPGVVDTPMQTGLRETPPELLPAVGVWRALHEQGQLRPVEEPATAVLWLASHFAAQANGRLFSLDDEAFRRQIATDLGGPLLPGRDRTGD
jgi:glucose 1-dehydrogenase